MEAVHDAARANDVEELQRLLDEDPEQLESENDEWFCERPLHVACHEGSMEAACYLLDRGAAIDSRRKFGATPLATACEMGRVGVVRLLLARGADPTLLDDGLWTTLMCASSRSEHPGSDHLAVIRLLLEDGRVYVDARNQGGTTALMMACSHGHTERARVLLLEGGGDPSIANNEGRTPMAWARQANRHEAVRLLEEYEREHAKAYWLSKARAVVDATESISKAPEKVGAKTEAEAQRAREEAAPAYLRGRVERGEALPSVEVVEQAGGQAQEGREEERWSVCEFIVKHMGADLCVELMAGVRCRRWVPEWVDEDLNTAGV